MKLLSYLFIYIYFILLFNCSAQTFSFEYSFGEYNSASAFSISSSGFIYLAEEGSNRLIKLDTLGNELKEIGGYGWSESAFDQPSDVFATPLNVFVCDKQNHRIQAFDKDLNFISELYTRENDNPSERFGYPSSCVISSMGDLYVLDSENIRILKFDLFGNFILNFGGYDAGIFSLQTPLKIAMFGDNSLLVLDDSTLIVYDQFGNGKNKFDLKKNFTNLNVYYGNVLLNSDDEIFSKLTRSSDSPFTKLELIGYNNTLLIKSCAMFNNKLYVLTPSEILIFKNLKE